MGKRKIKVLLICGGGGPEHDISLISADFFRRCLQGMPDVRVHYYELSEAKKKEVFKYIGDQGPFDFAIPCFHGYPGETGDIQSVFELINLPYLGSGPEGSALAFNKISSKLWAHHFKIPITPYVAFTEVSQESIRQVNNFVRRCASPVIIKPACQGSSLGVSKILAGPDDGFPDEKTLERKMTETLTHSSGALMEVFIEGRELEVGAYRYKGELKVTPPGEIITPNGFYDYQEKYSTNSRAKTVVKAKGLNQKMVELITEYSIQTFKVLKLRHMARIDFFLAGESIFLNEVNTFPGHTDISMFPMMMESHGVSYKDFLWDLIQREVSG